MDPGLWHVDRYEDFLNARRELLALKLNAYLDALIAEPEEVKHRPIAELVKLGESSVLEFKSTLQWDVTQSLANKALRRECLKTIAAFMNTDGGTLLIGVQDDGAIVGLSQDLNLLRGSRDQFEQLLVNIVAEAIGAALGHYYRIRFEPVDDKLVCVVEVDPVRDSGVFVKTEKGKEFFVRQGNTTRSLDPSDTHDYLRTR
jgi:predicted HTH transcriptional regulator